MVHGPLLAQLLMLMAMRHGIPLEAFSFRATAPLLHVETAHALPRGRSALGSRAGWAAMHDRRGQQPDSHAMTKAPRRGLCVLAKRARRKTDQQPVPYSHDLDGPQHHAEVCRQRQLTQVIRVEAGAFGKARFVAHRGLPEAGDAGTQRVIGRTRIKGLLAHHHRARPDQRHVPAQHVPELRNSSSDVLRMMRPMRVMRGSWRSFWN